MNFSGSFCAVIEGQLQSQGFTNCRQCDTPTTPAPKPGPRQIGVRLANFCASAYLPTEQQADLRQRFERFGLSASLRCRLTKRILVPAECIGRHRFADHLSPQPSIADGRGFIQFFAGC